MKLLRRLLKRSFLSFRVGNPYKRTLYHCVTSIHRRFVARLRPLKFSWIKMQERRDYQRWIAKNEPSSNELEDQKRKLKSISQKTSFLILYIIQDASLRDIAHTCHALQAQIYDQWQCGFLLRGEVDADVVDELKRMTLEEPRIKLKVSPNLKDAYLPIIQLLRESDCDYVVYLVEDGVLAPNALWEFAKAVQDQPDLDWIYSDEDVIDHKNSRHSPWFKPDWSPELLLSVNYLHPAVIRRDTVCKRLFQMRAEDKGDWRNTPLYFLPDVNARVRHIPSVLFHRRAANKRRYCPSRYSREMDQDHADWVAYHLRARGLSGVTARVIDQVSVRPMWHSSQPDVSILIPNLDHVQLLSKCLKSVLNKTSYPNFDVIILDTGSQKKETHDFYKEISSDSRISVVTYYDDFNYSKVNNFGAKQAEGDLFLFLNNDIEVMEGNWLTEMVHYAELPEIGIVGAKLLYPNRSIQHAGIILGLSGHAGHVFLGAKEKDPSPFGSSEWVRNVLAVTGACMLMRREVFEELGGFDEDFQFVFSDVEICLRAFERGYRNVVSPFTRIIHHEGATRGRFMPMEDLKLAYERFFPYLKSGDPYYNPNLSYASYYPRIALDEEGRVDRVLHILEHY